ncbi:MAG: signal peptidase I [Caryophanon sp.]|nr:signal peptidase I [Caryophanon sp.]
MPNFKHKLDDMFGDTSASEQRIQQNVRAALSAPQKKRAAWQVPTIASLATAVALFLMMTTIGSPFFSSSDGRGVPYDPLDDLYTINALKVDEKLSSLNENALADLPRYEQLLPLQYIDADPFTHNGETYAAVVERKAHIYDETVYEQGEIVRTKTYSGSHLPVYREEYYEIVAVPGDRIYLRDGELRINGERVHTPLVKTYKEQNVTIAGGYEQVLNAREYMVLNRFPAEGSLQGAAIIPVHKIYGEVVGVTTQQQPTTAATAEEAFDALLYDIAFRDGQQAQTWLQHGYSFRYESRAGEFFLEASYRNVTNNGDRVVLTYDFKREHGTVYTFTMYNVDGTWKLGPNE